MSFIFFAPRVEENVEYALLVLDSGKNIDELYTHRVRLLFST